MRDQDMTKFLLTLATAVASLSFFTAGSTALAGGKDVTGVVELFTSQGCSSCPPADKVLAALAGRDDVVALGYHVDYWDYLGWKDTLGSPENTARQYAYRLSLNTSTVYTPQAVINGASHENGADGTAIEASLKKPLPVTLDIVRMRGSVKIQVPAGNTGGRNVHAIMVRYGADRTVAVERGENGGRDIRYANPVTGIQTLGMWHGEAATFELPDDAIFGSKGEGCAILLQAVGPDGTPGQILGAAKIDSW
jgi:hypothetical protein